MSGPLLLLDAASLYFRAFYGVPESIKAPDGTPVNAVRGFTDMVARLVAERRPARLVACLDLDWRPAFRVSAIPSYKAHRVAEGAVLTGADGMPHGGAGPAESVPDALMPQVPIILGVLAAADAYLAVVEPVVRVATDAPVHLDRDDALPAEAVDPDRLAELTGRWGLNGPTDRLVAALRRCAAG